MNENKQALIKKLDTVKEQVKAGEALNAFLIDEQQRITLQKRDNVRIVRRLRAEVEGIRKDIRRLERLERNSKITIT